MWISPSLCSFPGNKCGTKFQNLLAAIKVCVCMWGGRCSYKFLLKKKNRTAKFSKILDLHKMGDWGNEMLLHSPALNSHKNLTSCQATPGYFAISVFLSGYGKQNLLLLVILKLLIIGISISSCLSSFFRSLCEGLEYHPSGLPSSPLCLPQVGSLPGFILAQGGSHGLLCRNWVAWTRNSLCVMSGL